MSEACRRLYVLSGTATSESGHAAPLATAVLLLGLLGGIAYAWKTLNGYTALKGPKGAPVSAVDDEEEGEGGEEGENGALAGEEEGKAPAPKPMPKPKAKKGIPPVNPLCCMHPRHARP